MTKAIRVFLIALLVICSAEAQIINKAEWFIDIDPGVGLANDLQIITPGDSLNFNANIFLPAGLSNGIHYLYTRFRFDNGSWSTVEAKTFIVSPTLVPVSTFNTINKLEYFIDTDPGAGNGIDLPVTASDSVNTAYNIVTPSNLPNGLHYLYIRARSDSNQWSMVEAKTFLVSPPVVSVSTFNTINKLEYFIDTDPGVGNGINLPVTPSDSVNTSFNIVTPANLPNGIHYLYIRAKSDSNQWSVVEAKPFLVSPPAIPVSTFNTINKLEYFIDTDPGVGNGINMPVTASDSVNNSYNIVTPANLANGIHYLYIRARSDSNQWSMIEAKPFVVSPPAIPLSTFSEINKLEYFIDIDPGVGNGIDLPVTPSDSINTVYNIVAPANLPIGTHYLYIRARSDSNVWNTIESDTFVVSEPGAALHFDGNNDRVLLGNSSLFNPDYISVQAWVKADNNNQSFRGVVSKKGGGGGNLEQWYLQTDQTKMRFHANTSNVDAQVTDPDPVPIGVWTNYSATYDGNVVKLYKNGFIVDEDSSADGTIDSLGWLAYIGAREGGADWWEGTIDEVRIWNYALSQQQIQTTLNCELTGNEPGLIAYYNFNQGIAGGNNTSEITLDDLTSNNLDGTLQSFTLNGATSNWISGSDSVSDSSCIPTYYLDADNDSYGNPLIDSVAASQPTGYVLDSTDCNDSITSIHPGATEICGNGIDEDCSGSDAACGEALHFDGSDDFVNVPHNSALNLINFTIESWIKTTTTQNIGRLVTKSVSGGQNYSLAIINGLPQIRFDNGVTGIVAQGSSFVNDGLWHHLSGVYDQAGGTLKIFVDGILAATTSSNTTPITSTEPLSIGRFDATYGEYLQCSLDEVRIWNIAHSQIQIQSAMNCEITTPQTGLIANYNFNQGVAGGNNMSPAINTLIDSSGNNNNGTLINFTLNGATSNWMSPSAFATGTSCAPDSLFITANGPTTFFQGDSVILSSSILNNNLWSNGATTQSITVTQSGNYYVVNNGDTSNIITVTVNPLPPATNNALHFDGTNNPTDYVFIGNNPLFNPAHITLQAWIKPDYAGAFRGVVTKRNCCGGNTEQWYLQTNSGLMAFHATTNNVSFMINDPDPLPVNTWTEYTGTYDGDVARLYKNGILVAEDFSPSGNITPLSWPVYIGDRDGGNDPWPGYIDEVRIWSKALTQQEIQENLNCELTGTEDSLIAYYNFNQGIAGGNNATETTLDDKTPNNLNGTLQNFAYNGGTSNWVASDSIKIPPVIAPAGPFNLCAGDSVQLSTQPSSCFLFQWYKNGSQLPGQTSTSVWVSDSGAYSVVGIYGTNADTSNVVTVTVSNSAAVTITANDTTTFCDGGSVILASNIISGNVWSNGSTSQSITVTQTGNYYAVNGCDTSNTITVTVNPVPPKPVIIFPGDSALCVNNSVTLEAPANVSSWTWSNGQTTQQITVTSAGAFIVTVTNSTGCSSVPSDPAYVNSLPQFTYYSDVDNDNFGNPNNSVSDCSQPSGYVLNADDCNDANNLINPDATEICDGIDNNCDQVIDNLTGTPAITGNTTICDLGTLSLTASGGDTYQWTGPNGFTASTASITINNVSVTDSGDYSVTIGYNGCSLTSILTAHVYVIVPPAAAISGLNNSYCVEGAVSVLTGIPAGGVFSGTDITGNTFNPNFVGTSSITYVSPSYYGCPADTAIQTTTVNDTPSVSITNSGSSFLCPDDTIILTANTTANVFLWSNGATIANISVTNPGAYVATVTNSAGCSAVSGTAYINNDTVLHITSNNGTSICDGDVIQLTFNANSIFWSTGETTSSISLTFTDVTTISFDTTISVTGISQNGCSYTDSLKITVNPGAIPGAVTNMTPPDSSNDLSYPLNLSWLPGTFNTKFDLYIWPSADTIPVLFASNIFSIGISINAGQGLSYGVQYKWRIVSKNGNCASTDGPVQTFTLRNLPDLVVQNISAPTIAVGGQTISVGWQIVNLGTGNTGSATWVDRIYLSPVDTIIQGNDILVGSHLNFSALNPGQAYSDSVNINIPINAAGTYYVIINTDHNLQVLESNETNNTSPTPDSINIILPPLPDLRVISVAAQTNVFSGTAIAVSYTLKNFGNASTPLNLRTDYIFISENSILDTVGLKVTGSFAETFSLAPGQTKTINATATVPKYIFGTYFVHVFTDAKGQIFEGPAETNNSNKDSINVFLTPPPDLVVYDLEIGDTLNNSDIVTVKYSLRNDGFSRTDSSWYDGIFISHDTVFDFASAIPLRWIFHSNMVFPSSYQVVNLPSGQVLSNNFGLKEGNSLKFVFGVPLPDTLTGNYNVFVVADYTNTIFEYNKENNNILRRGDTLSGSTGINQPVTFISPDLEVISVTAPAAADAGVTLNISWSVENNGPGRLFNKLRKDAVYLSTSPNNLNNAVFLGDLEYDIPLLKNQLLQRQKTVTLPVNISGAWYVVVHTDINNVVFENGIESNNIESSAAMQITISNWADLVPASINIPDTMRTTINYGITATVSNDGSLYADGSWTDALYISTSPVWDSLSSTLIKNFSHNGYVAEGASYAISEPVSVPLTSQIINGTDSSWYYFYYKADNNNQLFENTGNNNNVLKSDSVFVYNAFVDHIVTSVTGNDTAASGKPYVVQWTVKNIGEKTGIAYYSAWYDGIYRSTDPVYDASDVLIGNAFQNTPLNHDASYSKTRTYLLQNGISGDFYLIARTDINNTISGEIIKTNNYNLIRDSIGNPQLIHFTTPPPSDLEITSFTAPGNAIAGQPINIIFTIINNGPADADANSWIDQLSLSAGYYPGSPLLYNNNHITGLKVDSSYTDTIQVFIPNNAIGNYVLVFRTDAGDYVFEAGIENNNYAYSIISITQLPPCDLIAANIIAPDSALSGSAATISWDLGNPGSNPAYGNTREAVYLSEDDSLDNNDPLVGIVINNINIPTGSFITHNLTANLNGAFAGYNRVLVRVDLLNNINESDESNNVTAAADSIYISIKNLPIEVPTPDVLSNTNLMNYKIDVSALLNGESMSVSVVGDTINGNTELYVSFGQIPSNVVYGYADNNPYHKIKQVIIPALDSGTYYLTVKGTVTNSTSQNVTLLAHILPFEITKVETNHGGNTGNVTVKIEGSKFEQGMTAKLLSNPPGSEISAASIISGNSTYIWATFNLNQKPQGNYDVSLKKTDSSEAVLDSGFTIEPGNSGTFNVGGVGNTGMTGDPGAPGCSPGASGGINEGLQLSVNDFIERTGRNIPITILFANEGNVDIPVPTRLLVSDLFPVSWQNYFPNYNQKDLFIEFSEPGGPPGILRAGASGGITFYTRVIAPIKNHYHLR